MTKETILWIGTWYPSNIDFFLSKSFEDKGYNVIRIGQKYFQHYNIKWEESLLPEVEEEIDIEKSLDIPYYYNKYKPDILVFWDWVSTPLTNIEETRKLRNKIPFIVTEHEGWEQNFIRGNSLNPTLKYTGQPFGITNHPFNSETLGYKYLPGACYPKYHKYVNWNFNSRIYDCVLFAGMYSPRLEICKSLEKAGINIKYGNVNISDYEKYHNKSLSTWEFSGNQEYVKWRMFEAMSMGCVVLSDKLRLMNKLGFVPNVHYLEYKPVPIDDGRTVPKVDDLVNLIEYLKNNQKVWSAISDSAYHIVRKNHTYKHRVEMIINDINMANQ